MTDKIAALSGHCYNNRKDTGKNMKSLSAIIIAMQIASATYAYAEDVPFSIDTGDIPGPVRAELDALKDGGFVLGYEIVDLDLDGSNEVFVHLNTPMDSKFPTMLEWRVLDEQDGKAVQVGTWIGDQVSIQQAKTVDRENPDQIGTIPVIYSDGSFWILYKNKMRPYGDIASRMASRIHQGRSEDRSAFQAFGLEDVPEKYMARLELDVSNRPGKEVLISLFGDGFSRDSDGAAPYVLMSSSGDFIQQGVSFMHPSIYVLPDGGFQLIEAINFGYQVNFFPEEKTQ
ncbi:hypothetical protein [Pseudosulfitobacter pseudonitzschiae]|uniref:hypothetical protein n=1 Tax=Pseudosulfitobacter pseudonitzschiae TaxID=1402135 RepID=UPI003B78064E